MIIYSEKTKQKYNTIAECEEAEAKFDANAKMKEEEQKKLIDEKKALADKVMDAYKTSQDWNKQFIKLRNEFIDKYGYFHMTYRDEGEPFEDLLSLFTKWF